ncbi:hypothetical protein DY000_02000389 [Brassica cretica]|uniref:Spt4/RpoE2 zinc finger domain-containing protein n=1 Tax=Brassica cretica TaxID=69181 RepID=A0ABQ7C3Q1_BRACR|nr:hypothetical protein DY000_02000389 [Brassica cretica]
MGEVAAQIPTSFGHELRACLRCRLVKTYDQFRDSGCENCPFFKIEEDPERIVDVTTPNFNGYDLISNPQNLNLLSTVHSLYRVLYILGVVFETEVSSNTFGLLFPGKFAPGCYALAVSETLSEDMQSLCQEERVQYVPPKRI